jgi:hypothetical protein
LRRVLDFIGATHGDDLVVRPATKKQGGVLSGDASLPFRNES